MRHIVNLRVGTTSRNSSTNHQSMQSAGAPLQSATILPMVGAPWPSQATPYPNVFMAPPAWPMYRPPAQQASVQAKCEELPRQRHDLEARELKVERRTRVLNGGLDAVRDPKVKAAAPVAGSSHLCTQEQAPLKPKCASSQVASQRSLAPTQGPPQGSRSPVLLPLRL